MEAQRKPRLEDLKICANCHRTGWFFRKDEDCPWTCSICGSESVRPPRKDKGKIEETGIMSENDRIHAVEEGLEELKEIHRPGGYCDRCKADFWKHINALEVVQAKTVVYVGIVTGIIAGAPGAGLMILDLYRLFHGK